MTRTADVRTLATADLEAALALSSASGWNQRLDDWRMLLALAPAGSFAAVHGGRIVGTAIGIDYGTFGWIAMMLVDPDWRGQGVGARLLEAAMDAVPHHTGDPPGRHTAGAAALPAARLRGRDDAHAARGSCRHRTAATAHAEARAAAGSRPRRRRPCVGRRSRRAGVRRAETCCSSSGCSAAPRNTRT